MRRVLMEKEPVRLQKESGKDRWTIGDLEWVMMKALEKDRERRLKCSLLIGHPRYFHPLEPDDRIFSNIGKSTRKIQALGRIRSGCRS